MFWVYLEFIEVNEYGFIFRVDSSELRQSSQKSFFSVVSSSYNALRKIHHSVFQEVIGSIETDNNL